MGLSYVENIEGFDYLVGEINARKCKNKKGLCKELDSVFQWSKVGNVSCVDAMFDLAWHNEQNYKVIVNKYSVLDLSLIHI